MCSFTTWRNAAWIEGVAAGQPLPTPQTRPHLPTQHDLRLGLGGTTLRASRQFWILAVFDVISGQEGN